MTGAPAVYLLRVVLHDWPDHVARRILLHLREAAGPDTKLLLGDFILPLACASSPTSSRGAEGTGGGGQGGISGGGVDENGGERIQGVENMLPPPPQPLLPNLGKANSVAYWMDLTVRFFYVLFSFA